MPEAMVNYLALLGWNPGDEREDFSLAELVEDFSLERVQKSGASWDRDKLLSVNQRWMRKLTLHGGRIGAGLQLDIHIALEPAVLGLQLGRQRLADALDPLRGQRVVQTGADMQAAACVPVGDQQRELVAEQREDARIAARAHHCGRLAQARHPLHFRLVGEKGVTVQTRALHHRESSLQQLVGHAEEHVRGYAE